MSYFGEAPPACPAAWTSVIAFPSICILYGLLCILSFSLAIATALKLNNAAHWTKLPAAPLSNWPWVAYFLIASLRCACVMTQYAAESQSAWHEAFGIAAVYLRGFVVLALTLSLHHQHRFRTAASEKKDVKEDDRLATVSASLTLSVGTSGYGRIDRPTGRPTIKGIKQYMGVAETLYFLALLLFLLGTSLLLIVNNFYTQCIFLTLYWLQQIPVFILVCYIAMEKRQSIQTEGALAPSVKSKVYLVVAGVCSIADELPLEGWASILPDACVFYVASFDDIIHMAYGISLLFFFLYLRSEYQRNVEHSIWRALSQVQDSFDYH